MNKHTFEASNINSEVLHMELVKANIDVKFLEYDNTAIYLTLDDNVDLKLVQKIIDAHDPLSSVKNDKATELNETCNKTILGRFKATIDGTEYEFSYDYESQSRFNGIGVLFFANKINEIEWTAYRDGERVRITLNQDNFDIVTFAALQHQNSNIIKYNQLLAQVNNATTKEQVEAIVWDE